MRLFKIYKKAFLCITGFFVFIFMVLIQMLWAVDIDLSLTVGEGTLYIDVVDADGVPVVGPTFTFTEKPFSFDAQDFTGTLGTSSQKFRISNPTATETWNVAIAAENVADVWTDGTYNFAYNAESADNGRLTLNPAVGTVTGVGGCSTTNIDKGSSAYFLTGSVNSIDLLTAGSGTEIACRWDFTGVEMTQRIPAAQPPSTYSIGMVVTVN